MRKGGESMTQEVVNTTDSSGNNFLIGVILLIVALALFFYFGIPLIQNATAQPQINVPKQVDVNVKQNK